MNNEEPMTTIILCFCLNEDDSLGNVFLIMRSGNRKRHDLGFSY